jgi:hypothetical protein
MPTFEIVSVGAKTGPHMPRVGSFIQRCDSRLTSDRGLFQPVLDRLDGTIVHLGHRSKKHERDFWFCGHALDFSKDIREGCFRLRNRALVDLKRLFVVMQKDSPFRHVIFLSDYQFGPTKPVVKQLSSIEEFLRHGASGSLRFNALYHIKPRPQRKSQPAKPTRDKALAANLERSPKKK